MINHTQLPTKKILYGTIAGLVTFAIAFNTTGLAAGLLLTTIQASAKAPVLLETSVLVTTAFNGTPTLTLGTDAASANQLLAAADITEGTPGVYPAGAGVGRVILTANTNIYVKLAATSPTTGLGKVLLKMTVLDVDQVPQTTV